MLLSLIAAASENHVIGNKGKIPWHLPADLRHFRDLTRRHPVIMGRKTYESIGHPLPDRANFVVTKTCAAIPGCAVTHSLDTAIKAAESLNPELRGSGEIFIIGGEQIYRLALPTAHRIYLTVVHATFEGDAFFPEFSEKEWRETSRERHEADAGNPYAYSFVTYERIT